ncbi:hypothetical protein GPA22_22095 [Aromatoleum toluvorans]|uniref:Uncharacterized protein n=1 Tax=Aromatoleum toluvorans TaxID=92002 RepID=A0ABX1Q3X8_9RHOO|nr:hypothetical protein [Aromatoleum toluvorans]NMG46413.1 hypothetical protein [Aromatoleum toluvorans]
MNEYPEIADPQGWERACTAMRSASDVDLDHCANALREGLGRAGAVLRALQNLMHSSQGDERPGDRATLVEIALEEVEALDELPADGGIADQIERMERDVKHRLYRQLRYGEGQATAARALSVALVADSGAAELDAVAKALWPHVEGGDVAATQWDAFCAAVQAHGLVVHMHGLPAVPVPEVMTREKAKALRKHVRAAERLGKRIAELEAASQAAAREGRR